MVAFTFRMGAGFAGDVNRTHPASITPAKINTTTPPAFYGQAVIVDAATSSVRPLAAGDTAITVVHGITVRPYPVQAASATNYGAAALGTSAPPTSGVIDVMKSGYIMVRVNGSPNKDGTVYVWIAASSGAHIQGGFEAAATSGSTIALSSNYKFNGAPDANGITEISVLA